MSWRQVDEAIEEAEAAREADAARNPYVEIPFDPAWFEGHFECPHKQCKDWRSTELGLQAHVSKAHPELRRLRRGGLRGKRRNSVVGERGWD